MASEKKMNDAAAAAAATTTSFQQSATPILCANGCGFFGAPSTLNLCSKCYIEKSSMSSVPPPSAAVEEPMIAEPPPVVAVEEANRCGCCKKKVGVTGFKCRCGITFCGSHRYPEEHQCSFDFKGAGRDAIEKANPLVKADKMERL